MTDTRRADATRTPDNPIRDMLDDTPRNHPPAGDDLIDTMTLVRAFVRQGIARGNISRNWREWEEIIDGTIQGFHADSSRTVEVETLLLYQDRFRREDALMHVNNICHEPDHMLSLIHI